MSLVIDRRKQVGDRPGTHALVCGVGSYPFANRMHLAGQLSLPSHDPLASATGRRIQRWLTEHAEDLVAPLATCRVLLSTDNDENLTPPTLDEFLRAASAWREDASTHPDGMTFLYMIAHGIALSRSSDVLFLEDFGNRRGGLLHNAIETDSLSRGMAPTYWESNIARNQLFFIDVIEPREPIDAVISSQPSTVFDVSTGEVPDDRVVMTFRGVTLHDRPSRRQGISSFADALIACLEGEAVERLPDGRFAITTTALARALPLSARERQGPDSSQWEEVRVSSSVGSPRSQIILLPRTLPMVPVLITFRGYESKEASLTIRDSNLTQVHSEHIDAESRETHLELSPGLYLFELSRPGVEVSRVFVPVSPPQITVELADQAHEELILDEGNEARAERDLVGTLTEPLGDAKPALTEVSQAHELIRRLVAADTEPSASQGSKVISLTSVLYACPQKDYMMVREIPARELLFCPHDGSVLERYDG